MVGGAIHSFRCFSHSFSFGKHRFEQGFLSLSTLITSGYYDYLYNYKSRCEKNLSLNWGRA